MADAWVDVCRQCVNLVTDVPPYILLVAFAATFLGLFVLVRFPSRSNAPGLGSRELSTFNYKY